MKNTFILTAICLFFSFAAFAGVPTTSVGAKFAANKINAVVGETVDFMDQSVSTCGIINSWQWNFGTGATPSTSNMQNPTGVVYTTPGPKTISLTVITAGSCQDNATEVVTLSVAPPAQDLPVLNRTRLFLFGTLIFGVTVLVMVRLHGRG